MIIHQLTQGTQEWLAYRATHFNASDAPAMMGVSPYKTRNQLLHEAHTGLTQEVNRSTQRRFDDGHRFEALARPLAEEIIGEDLYPVVGSVGKLSASFDGLTIANEVNFEHKSLNEALRKAMVDGCTGADLPLAYQVQMEQQHLVSGAEKTLFMASEWDDAGNLVEERHCWYVSNLELRQEIIDGWEQLERDLATYAPPETEGPKAVGVSPESLPALHIEVKGAVTASNLAEFKSTAVAVIGSISTELETDQDFANAEKTVKWCEDVEKRLEAAKEHALSQTASIDELFKAIDAIAEITRNKRLSLNKLVKDRKEQIRTDIVIGARLKFKCNIEEINNALGDDYIAIVYPDFAGAIKGKKTVDSIQNAVDTLLAQSSQSAMALAKVIRQNIDYLDANAADNKHLFPDLKSVVSKAGDDFEALVQVRVSKYKQEQEDARNRALRIEQERIKREQQALDDQTAQQAIEDAKAKEPEPAPASRPATAIKQDDGALIKLGDINARIAPLSITADGLSQLGFVCIATDKSAKLYRQSEFGAICEAMVSHIKSLAEACGGGGV